MTPLRSLMVLACAAGAIGLSATRAGADTQQLGGGFCQPHTATNNVQYTNYGFVNISTTATITAECPYSPTFNTSVCLPTFSSVAVVVYDRNANASKDVVCTLKYIKANGDIVRNFTQHSMGSSATSQALNFFSISSLTGGSQLHLTCSVPPKTGSGFSAITYYDVITTACQ
jgi:hypothetical protein